MLETAERLVTEEKEPAVQQFLLLVGGLRAMAGGRARGRPGARLLPAALAVGRRLRAVLRPLRPLRRRGAAPLLQPVGRRGAVHGCASCPGSATPAPRRLRARRALLTGDWPLVHAAEPRHLAEASALVAAYLAWHLERGLRSMAYVER